MLYQEYTNMKLEEMKTYYLGLFHGGEDLYGNPCGADPCPKSRLWSCSINCDLRSLKKSSLVVSSTRVDDGTGSCLPYSTACVYNKKVKQLGRLESLNYPKVQCFLLPPLLLGYL
jgi:hypothetical protein